MKYKHVDFTQIQNFHLEILKISGPELQNLDLKRPVYVLESLYDFSGPENLDLSHLLLLWESGLSSS